MRKFSMKRFSPVAFAISLAVGIGGCADGTPPATAEPAAEAAAGSTFEAPMQQDVHRFSIGRFEAFALKDGRLAFPNDGETIGIGRSPDEVGALLRAAGEPVDMLHLSIQVLLVKAGDRVVLFDAGAGDAEAADAGRLPASLQAAGIDPGEVTDIFISHGHWDHLGGTVDARGNARFPNATVRMSGPEWQALQEDAQSTSMVEALQGRVEPFEPGDEVLPGVTSVPVVGHTPGHSAYAIASDGERLLYIGDTAHHHVVSVQRPGWTIAFDRDAPVAERSRKELLARAAEESALIHSPHFPFPGLGRIERSDDGFRWVPLD